MSLLLFNRAFALVLLVVALLASGCGKSTWELEFMALGPAQAPLADGAPVRVREAPWKRVEQVQQELSEAVAASDSPPDEWPQERKDEHKARLLRGLQVTAEPARVRLLGRSEFRSTNPLRADSPELVKFARTVGATDVVYARTFLGAASRVVDRPVTTFRSGSAYSPWRQRGSEVSFTESETTWVPTTERADEYAWAVFYLAIEP